MHRGEQVNRTIQKQLEVNANASKEHPHCTETEGTPVQAPSQTTLFNFGLRRRSSGSPIRGCSTTEHLVLYVYGSAECAIANLINSVW